MLTKTFELTVNGKRAAITVHTATGRDYLKRQILYNRVLIERGHDEDIFWTQFGRALTQSVVDGDLGFNWPSVIDEPQIITNARECWLNLPEADFERWLEALAAVDMPPQPIELTPDAEKNE